MGRKAIDLTGQRFGNLVAEYRITNSHGYARWACTCDCGATHNVRGTYLVSGTVTRCRRCSKLNESPETAAGSETVVEVYLHAAGLEGGFAVARDAQGVALALTPWSRQPQNVNRPLETIVLAQRVMRQLVAKGRVRARQEKEGPARWMRRVSVQVHLPAARYVTPWHEMLAVWMAAGGKREDAHPGALPPAPPRVVPVVLG